MADADGALLIEEGSAERIIDTAPPLQDSPALRRDAGLGVGLAAFSAAIFGFGTTFAVLAYQGASNPLTVVFFRTAAFIVFVGLFLAARRRFARLSPATFRGSLWMAATLFFVALGYQGSVAYIPVGLAALVFYTFPLMVGAVAVLAGRDRMSFAKAATLITGLLGLALALSPGLGVLDWRGIALALSAALAMALTMAFGGAVTRGQDSLLIALYTNVWMLAALCLVVAGLGGIVLPGTGVGTFGLLSACVTYLVAYVCWYASLSLVRPVQLSILFNIEPLVTLAVGWLVLGERMSGLQVFGALLVVASIVSMSLASSRDPAA